LVEEASPMWLLKDSQIVIEGISSTQQGSSKFSSIISNIKSLLLVVPNFEVKFIKRQTNMTAPLLSKGQSILGLIAVTFCQFLYIEQFFISYMNWSCYFRKKKKTLFNI
jgi:hypothetical protein